MADRARPSCSTTVVLRKRKRSGSPLVLRLSSSPAPSRTASHSDSEYEPPLSPVVSITLDAGPSTTPTPAKKRYACDFEGCHKAYSKPARLAEHQRSHTGDRPFFCKICSKSYLRESHLQAHSRSHLPESARPFICEEAECGKRFWTSQHLLVHERLHKGEKPFRCNESSCYATFAKQYQLREHICATHAPPGTKSFRCDHPGCTKSFATNQKLRAHTKTHDEKRYTCAHAECLHPPAYFANWTALQHHMRTAHPPTCPYAACGGRTFSAQKGLRAHLRIHAERELEAELERHCGVGAGDEGEADDRPRKRRRGGEVGRDWACEEPGCEKDFKSKRALATHHRVTHLGRRDFACPTCGRAFGYKHLLQRHTAKAHPADPASSVSGSESGAEHSTDEEDHAETPKGKEPATPFSIDFITGAAYDARSQARLSSGSRSLQCPFPDLPPSLCCSDDAERAAAPSSVGGGPRCLYVFSRAYDLRRHLLAEHKLEPEREVVDEWVRSAKAARAKETA